MSGDGEKLIFAGTDADGPIVYTVNADGSGLTSVPLPSGATSIPEVPEVAIDQDGSRAFFVTRGVPDYSLYKVENGAATYIFDPTKHDAISDATQIQATADGNYLYFLVWGGGYKDVWRIQHGGGAPEKIIEDEEVLHGGNPGAIISQFAISADGGAIAFILQGYWSEGFKAKQEVFALFGGTFRQLSDDSENIWKDYVAISGDGSTVVYATTSGSPRRWYSVRSDGRSKTDLKGLYFSVGGPALTYDGSEMFYTDQDANGGSLLTTDGSGRQDLFPPWSPINIAAHWGLSISDDGSRVSFVFNYASFPFKDALYVGYLNPSVPIPVPDAPVISSITFNPLVMPTEGDATITVTSAIGDRQGLSDISAVSIGQLVEGRVDTNQNNSPITFSFPGFRDDGEPHDETAGDGVYNALGRQSSVIDRFDQVTMRVGVADSAHTVTVADTVLRAGGAAPAPTPTPAPTPSPATGDESSRAVGTSGGEVKVRGGWSEDGGVTVDVPADTWVSTVTMTVSVSDSVPGDVVAPSGSVLLPKTVEVTTDTPVILGRGVEVLVNLTITDRGSRSMTNIRGGVVVGNRVVPKPTRVVDEAAGLIAITVDHFTKFTIFEVISGGATLSAPADGALLSDFGPTLVWTNPSGVTQYHLQVVPFNNDGPGVDVHIGSAGTFFNIPPPPEWYGLLPDMTYAWRVRVSDVSTFVGLDDPSWSDWSVRTFKTPAVSSATIGLVSPAQGTTLASTQPVALQWSNSSTAVFYYEIQVSGDPTFNTDPATAISFVWQNLVHGGVTDPPNSWMTPELPANGTFYWRVRQRLQGDGTPLAWSTTWSFRTP